MTLLFRLLFSHVLADFFFQTDEIIKGKESRGSQRYAYQVLHGLIHAITAYLVVADWTCWMIPLVIFITHIIMDYIKVEFMEKNVISFLVDQIFHLLVIACLALSLTETNISVQNLFTDIMGNTSLWIVITAYMLVLKPSAILIGLFVKKWTPPTDTVRKSLLNAGKWIGYLERVLIITFILTGNAEAIGFLLAAKSIFRFGEMNKATEIKTTEYVLVGTFASFTVAILLGFIVTKLI